MAFSSPERGVLPYTTCVTIHKQKPRAGQRGYCQSSIMTQHSRTACRPSSVDSAKVIRQNSFANHGQNPLPCSLETRGLLRAPIWRHPRGRIRGRRCTKLRLFALRGALSRSTLLSRTTPPQHSRHPRLRHASSPPPRLP